MDALVSTEWLAAQLGASDLRVADASWFLPEHGRDAAAEFAAGHIPGAVFLDLDSFANKASPLPSMLPSPEQLVSRMQALGLGDGVRIVIYDDSPLHTSARAWWMLHAFGTPDVAILDGGHPVDRLRRDVDGLAWLQLTLRQRAVDVDLEEQDRKSVV